MTTITLVLYTSLAGSYVRARVTPLLLMLLHAVVGRGLVRLRLRLFVGVRRMFLPLVFFLLRRLAVADALMFGVGAWSVHMINPGSSIRP